MIENGQRDRSWKTTAVEMEMISLLFARKSQKKTYDRENQRPVLRCSICTGEQVAGFKDIHTGKFEEIMLIRSERELNMFKEMYGISSITKEY